MYAICTHREAQTQAHTYTDTHIYLKLFACICVNAYALLCITENVLLITFFVIHF